MVLTLIIVFGFAMSAIALIGSLTLILPEAIFDKIVLPLVSLAAGTLLGGAFFHMLPEAINSIGNKNSVYICLVLGFIVLFVFEQFLHWHHCHCSKLKHKPVSYSILMADGIHNLIGGLSVGSAFIIDIKLGIVTWFAAALHEIPQELGDFGILVNSGWNKTKALIFNFISALTFPIGAIIAYIFSDYHFSPLVLAFAAGNFIYIAASDLIPQLNTCKTLVQISQFVLFILGLVIMLLVKILS